MVKGIAAVTRPHGCSIWVETFARDLRGVIQIGDVSASQCAIARNYPQNVVRAVRALLDNRVTVLR